MKYSFKSIVQSYPKNHIESWWTRFTVRPLSFPIAWALANMGCTAWLASVFSILVALLSCIFFCIPFIWSRIVAISLVVLWQILDCVDGTIARTTKKTSSMGEFIDAQSGYTIMAFIFICVGFAGFYTSVLVPEQYRYLIIFIGGISSISNITARLINSKFNYSALIHEYKNNGSINVPDANAKPTTLFSKIRVFLDFNLGLVGIFVPLLILAEIFHFYDILTCFYCIYSLIGFAASSLVFAYKAK